jgi:predicted pyridoxine 5'-phosphate oxidase superfamily flavin-nucleotide-binding protein
MTEPFHEGELAIQERAGERDKAVLNGRAISDTIPNGARPFLTQQAYCAVGWVDKNSNVWSSLLVAPAGFARSESEGKVLAVDISPHASDLKRWVTNQHITEQMQLGMLFIELGTRRRLRVNGVVTQRSDEVLRLTVGEAYPNCPKYIQRREVNVSSQLTSDPGVDTRLERGDAIPADLDGWLAVTDTLFVSSAHPDGRLDCSHRGGKPGFIQRSGNDLVIPDYAGNSMFGTLGNFALNPQGGLSLVDFDSNRQLQLTGRVTLQFDTPDPDGQTGGTGRWWRFTPTEWVVMPLPAGVDWTYVDSSPYNP